MAALFARLFMRPDATRPVMWLLEHFPRLLTEGARLSGKTAALRGARQFDTAHP
jgi:hypothetical protein